MLLQEVLPVESEYERRQRLHKMLREPTEMFFCEICNCVWEKVSACLSSVVNKGFCIYPKGILPTLGKIRKKCPDCK